MVNRGRVSGSVLSAMWRIWLLGVVIVVVGATTVSDTWHTAHDGDSSCVDCELTEESLAEPSKDFQGGPSDDPEPPTSLCVTTLVMTHLDVQVPARAPPLS